jgi:hypothetical protein
MVRPEKLYLSSGCESRRGKPAEAPRSRFRTWGEIPPSKRNVESLPRAIRLVGGEQGCGPSCGEPLQPRDIGAERRGGRACHVEAKAIDCVWGLGDATQDPSGVGKAAHSHSQVRNRRDPTQRLTSSKDPGYKPSAKCQGVGRESEGLVVLRKPMKVGGGKGPCFGQGVQGRTCEGMVARPNNPKEKARQATSHLGCMAERRLPRSAKWRFTPGVTPWSCHPSGGVAGVHADTRRPSVSRVREIRTHGLKGGRWKRAA